MTDRQAHPTSRPRASTLEGWGSSSNVNYTYSLTTGTWHCTYQTSIHRILLELKSGKVLTEPFSVAGYKWQLFVENKGTGRIGMYLVSRNGTEVDLCYTFMLLNSKSKTRNVVKSHRSHFRVGECLGSSSFASIESIRDRQKGFIDGDSFTLRVEMRVMVPENEGQSSFALPHSGTYTWALRDLKELDRNFRIASRRFFVGHCEWRLKLFPRGMKDGDRHMHLYLELRDGQFAPVHTNLLISVQNYKSEGNNLSIRRDFRFDGMSRKGVSDFLPISALDSDEGYVRNGWLTVVFQFHMFSSVGHALTTLDPTNLSGTSRDLRSGPSGSHRNKSAHLQNKNSKRNSSNYTRIAHSDIPDGCLCRGCSEILEEVDGVMICPICRKPVRSRQVE